MSGPTGCGKTLSAKRRWPEACILNCSKDMWFDGYNGADVVIFDEFRHDSIEFTLMLAICDFNKGIELRVKGSFVFFHPKIIVFTSPENPEREFSYRHFDGGVTLRSDFAQIKRRLEHIVEFVPELRVWRDSGSLAGSD